MLASTLHEVTGGLFGEEYVGRLQGRAVLLDRVRAADTADLVGGGHMAGCVGRNQSASPGATDLEGWGRAPAGEDHEGPQTREAQPAG